MGRWGEEFFDLCVFLNGVSPQIAHEAENLTVAVAVGDLWSLGETKRGGTRAVVIKDDESNGLETSANLPDTTFHVHYAYARWS